MAASPASLGSSDSTIRTSTSRNPFFSRTRREAVFSACGTEAIPEIWGYEANTSSQSAPMIVVPSPLPHSSGGPIR
jgi:hypothetical protein